jgi:plasmid stabilization system protein ParE
MKYRLVLRKATGKEYDDAGNWYEQQREGLGEEFTESVQWVLDRIAANPLIHALVLHDVRKAVVKKFPYVVYYRVRQSSVIVLSVFHTLRDPLVWQSRV